MKFERTGIAGAWVVELPRFEDERGWFQEWFRSSRFSRETGIDFSPVQANISRSRAGTVRGIHYSIAPQGQGKLVTAMAGALDDYIVDIRLGSPTFGQWHRVRLEASSARAVLLDPHLGHAFQALADDTVVSYLVSAEYNPSVELGITPTCRDLKIEWADGMTPLISSKDRDSPTFAEQLRAGKLPEFFSQTESI